MPIITDFTLLNNAGTANWTASGFDSPTLNNSASTTPIYIEGTACLFWPLKKGVTNGYTYGTGTGDMTGRLVVAWLNYPYADISAIPITAIAIRVSSSTTFTTNYAQWNALSQITAPFNTPISGHTPIMAYPTNPDGTAGTVNYASLSRVGWVATSGGVNDGKQGGFDMFFLIGWIGAHSATYTNTFFSSMAADATPSTIPGTTNRPLGVLSRSGDFYQSNVNFQIGQGTSDTTNIVISETNKTIYFNNVEPEHDLGYVFVNPSGANTSSFTLTGCVHFWNSQQSTAEVFTNPNNADTFKLDGCSFARGGQITLPSHTVDRFVNNSKFENCGKILVKDCTFEGNTVSNATVGVKYEGTGTRRAKNNVYSGCTDALEFDTAQTITLDGDTFSGNTTDILFTGTGTLTINTANGANPSTSRVTGGGTVVINNDTTITLTGLVNNTEVTVYDSGTGALIAQVENVTGNTFQFSDVAANVVNIFIHNVAYYRADVLNFTIPATDASIPIQQVPDPNYVNN